MLSRRAILDLVDRWLQESWAASDATLTLRIRQGVIEVQHQDVVRGDLTDGDDDMPGMRGVD